MNTKQVIEHMQSGSFLHLRIEDDERIYWLTQPEQRIHGNVVRAVLRDEGVKPDDDALIPGMDPPDMDLFGQQVGSHKVKRNSFLCAYCGEATTMKADELPVCTADGRWWHDHCHRRYLAEKRGQAA